MLYFYYYYMISFWYLIVLSSNDGKRWYLSFLCVDVIHSYYMIIWISYLDKRKDIHLQQQKKQQKNMGLNFLMHMILIYPTNFSITTTKRNLKQMLGEVRKLINNSSSIVPSESKIQSCMKNKNDKVIIVFFNFPEMQQCYGF